MIYKCYCWFVALLLGFINPLRAYGTPLFEALMRLTIGLAFEAACVRRHPETGKIQVALWQRSANESFAPLDWHFPGTFYRPWETPMDVLKRLCNKEFKTLKFSQAFYVGIFRASKADMGKERGHTNSEVWLFLDAEFTQPVSWFDVQDGLPEGIFYSHFEYFIPWAVEAFLHWEKRGASAVRRVDSISGKVLIEGG